MTNTIEDLQELRTMRVSWQVLARRWELSGAELSSLLPAGGWDLPAPPCDTERRMRLMLEVDYRLPIGMEAAEVSGWARTPVEELGFQTPIEIISAGPAHIRELRDFLEWKFS